MFSNFIIKSFRITSAIQENPIHSVTYRIIILIGDILLFGGMILALFQTNKMVYSTFTLGVLFCGCFGCSLKNLSKIYEKLFLRIMNKVLSTHLESPCFIDKAITLRAESIAEQNWGVEIIAVFFTVTVCLYCPYFYLVTKPGISLDHPDLQLIPYFHSYWSTETLFHYMSKRFFEIIVTFSSMAAYMNFTIFMVYSVTNIETHVKEVNYLLSNAIDRRVKTFMKLREYQISQQHFDCYFFESESTMKKQEYMKCVEEDFTRMIKYHQFIHSYMNDVTCFLHKPFTLLFAWYISSTILFIYVFLQITDDYIFIIKMLSLAIHGTVALHLYCRVAQMIHQMNEQLMDSFYNISWYHIFPKTRKNLLLTLTLCQRKYNLKCFGMYVVNLNLFIYALRIVYSVINIIRVNSAK